MVALFTDTELFLGKNSIYGRSGFVVLNVKPSLFVDSTSKTSKTTIDKELDAILRKAGKGCVSTIEAIQLMLEEYVDAAQRANVALRDGTQSTRLADLLFFFKLLYCQIADSYDREVKDKPPMDEEEKERQRLMHDQREKGKKRRLENKLEHWQRITQALEAGEIQERPRNGRCFNCKQREHEAKDCPKPCRYCKDPGHWSGICDNKKARHAFELKQQIPITKAL